MENDPTKGRRLIGGKWRRDLPQYAQPQSKERYGAGQWTFEELQQMISEKIVGKTPSATVEIQTAYKLFGRPADGITCRLFHKQLKKCKSVSRNTLIEAKVKGRSTYTITPLFL